MMSPTMLVELCRLRQEELLAEAAQDRLACQARAKHPTPRKTSYLAAAYKRIIRLCQPVGLAIRRSA